MSISSSTRTLAALLAVAASLCVFASAASAANPTKGDAVTLGLGKSGGPLLARGVTAAAISPGKLSARRLSLPVSDVTTPGITAGQLVLSGGLTLRAGRRSVKLRGFLVTVKGTRVTVSAKVGAKRLTVLTGTSFGTGVDATRGVVDFSAKSLSLSKRGAAAIASALGTRRVRAGKLSSARGHSTITAERTTNPGGGSGNPSANFGFPSVTELARPAAAADVASATGLVFWPRDSFINYNAAGGGLTYAEGVATNGPAIDTYAAHACPFDGPSAARSYSFNLPFASGWWDDASKTGVLRYSGGVRFTYPAHGINQLYSDPIVEFNGADSRVLFNVTDESDSVRADLISIPGVAAPQPALTTYNGKATEHANMVLGGFYPKGVAWGCVQLGFGS